MNTGPDKADETGSPPTAGKKEKKQRYWVRWTIFGIVCFLAVLAVVLSVLPKYAGRYLMENELAKIGIETTGSETIYVNLWRGEMRMGPVEFWSEGAERGQIGMVGAELSLATLLKKRALIETFIIEEVDLIIEKRDQGIFVNGVSLRQFMTAEADTEAKVEEEVEKEAKSGWGAGIDEFEFRNSKMILRNFVENDDLEIDIERLAVTLFHTWAPDEPGVVLLRGAISGAPLTLDAVLRPFAEDIQFRFTVSLENVTMADALNYGRIALIIDRDLFEKREGTGSTKLAFAGVVQSDGGINMNGQQTVTIDGLHLVTPEGVSIEVERAEIELLSSEDYTPDGRIEVAGTWESEVSGLKFDTPDGQSVALTAVKTEMNSFFFELNADKSIHAFIPHQSRIEGLTARPDPNTTVTLGAGTFGLEKFTFDQTPEGAIEAGGAIRTTMEQLGSSAGPDTQIGAGSVAADVTELAVKRDLEGNLTVTGIPTVEVASVELKGATPLTVDRVSLELSPFAADVAGETTSVRTTGLATVSAIKLSAPGAEGQPGTDATVQSVRVDMQDFNASVTGGDIKVNGGIASEIAGLAANIPGDGGAMTVAAEQVRTSFPTLKAQVSGGATSVETTGSTTMSAFKLTAPGAKGKPGTDASVQSARVDVQDFKANVAGGDVKVDGAIDSEIAGLAASIPGDGGSMTVAADKVRTSFPTLNAQVSGGATSVNLAGKTDVAGFKTSIPSVQGSPAITVGLGSLDVVMKEIAASLAGAAPRWNVAADVAVTKVDTELRTAQSSSTVNVGSVRVSGVKTDQALAVAIGEIVVAGLDADLVDKDLKAFGGGEEKAPSKDSEGDATKVRLGRLAVGDQSVVKFTDTSVDPPVIVVVNLDDVEVKNIDTGDPAKRTDLKLNATINESSKLGVTGWATPLKPTPDFNLNVNLKALPLPAYSSYVSNAIGWHLDGGELSTSVTATAQSNALKGQVGVAVDNLFLNPVTAADGEKLEKQIGVPVQFAVGILKDDQGTINLDLPLSGTLDSPKVDYSSVIRKAISGFLGSIFGTNSFQGGDGFKLQPVVFAPGAATLDETGKQMAQPYVAMLEKKPSLKLGVCGRATVQDFVALFGSKAMPPAQATAATPPRTISSAQAKAMVELAMERTNAVRSYLVDERGINTDRIVQCRVTYNLKDTQPPRAQFAM